MFPFKKVLSNVYDLFPRKNATTSRRDLTGMMLIVGRYLVSEAHDRNLVTWFGLCCNLQIIVIQWILW